MFLIWSYSRLEMRVEKKVETVNCISVINWSDKARNHQDYKMNNSNGTQYEVNYARNVCLFCKLLKDDTHLNHGGILNWFPEQKAPFLNSFINPIKVGPFYTNEPIFENKLKND